MSSKTKIVVLRMKELIYTGIFVALGILLILLLVYMFSPKDVSEALETMYPLMEPALESLAEQICSTQSLEGLTYASENQYTSQVLLDAVSRALDKAAVTEDDSES